MRRIIGLLILSFALIVIASPSFSGDKRKDKMKDKRTGNPFEEILEQITIMNDKLDELLANGMDLRGVTQNWDKKLPANDGPPCNSSRFTCIFPDTNHPDGAAVRDNETGLVWERFPDTDTRIWAGAIHDCAFREVGGRRGWSLPTREQLASLIDKTGTGVDGNGNPLKLSDGHPFQNVRSALGENYWTSTTTVEFDHAPENAWIVGFSGDAGDVTFGRKRFSVCYMWCVRGGQSYDGQDLRDLIYYEPLD
jgi:hypothetical protein